MDIFFSKKTVSINSTGTLCQIKEDFDHRSVTRNVLDKFNHVWNLLKVN